MKTSGNNKVYQMTKSEHTHLQEKSGLLYKNIVGVHSNCEFNLEWDQFPHIILGWATREMYKKVKLQLSW